MSPKEWNRATEELIRLSTAFDRATARERRRYLRLARKQIQDVKRFLDDLQRMAALRNDGKRLKDAHKHLVQACAALRDSQ